MDNEQAIYDILALNKRREKVDGEMVDRIYKMMKGIVSEKRLPENVVAKPHEDVEMINVVETSKHGRKIVYLISKKILNISVRGEGNEESSVMLSPSKEMKDIVSEFIKVCKKINKEAKK